MAEKKEQKVVTEITKRDGSSPPAKIHPSIREAADHAGKHLGPARDGDGKRAVQKALEGGTLPPGTTKVPHRDGEVRFTPVEGG